MKNDRIYGITLYLLTHKRTPARELAEYFEVSIRTIQRDIDTLSMAKIPIIAYEGVNGGYELQENFKLNTQLADKLDYTWITTALKGLNSAIDDKKLNETAMKMQTMPQNDNTLTLDFSILKENPIITNNLSIIRKSIEHKHLLTCSYTNASSITSIHTLKPITLLYQWYSWYLIAMNEKEEYRMYKLIRMSDLHELSRTYCHTHLDIDDILQQIHNKNTQNIINITLLCRKAIRTSVLEYLPGKIIEEKENGDFIYQMHVPEHEHFYMANLIALGNGIQILEPKSEIQRICKHCKEILQLYENL